MQETLALAQSRIESLGAVHDLLAEENTAPTAEQLTTVQGVVKKVADIILNTMAQQHQRVSLNVEAGEFPLGQRHATLLGLVLNELVCNALTHGLRQRAEGMILIEAEEADELLRVCVTDDGVGLPEDFNLAQSNGLGMSIVKGLMEQIDGDFHMENVASDGQSPPDTAGRCARDHHLPEISPLTPRLAGDEANHKGCPTRLGVLEQCRIAAGRYLRSNGGRRAGRCCLDRKAP